MAYKAQASFSSGAVGNPLDALNQFKKDMGRVKVNDVSTQQLQHIEDKDNQFNRIVEGGMDLAATEVPVGIDPTTGEPKTEQFWKTAKREVTPYVQGAAAKVGQIASGIRKKASSLGSYMEARKAARKAKNFTKEIETSHYDRPLSEVQENEWNREENNQQFEYMKQRRNELAAGEADEGYSGEGEERFKNPSGMNQIGEMEGRVPEDGQSKNIEGYYDPNYDYVQQTENLETERVEEFRQGQKELAEKHLKETKQSNWDNEDKATMLNEYNRLTEEGKILDDKAKKSAEVVEQNKKIADGRGAFINEAGKYNKDGSLNKDYEGGSLYNAKNYNKDGSINTNYIAKQAAAGAVTEEVINEIKELKYQSKMYGDWAKGKGNNAVRLAELGKKNGLSEKQNNELRSAVDKYKKDHPKAAEEAIEAFEAAYYKSLSGRKKKKINLKKKTIPKRKVSGMAKQTEESGQEYSDRVYGKSIYRKKNFTLPRQSAEGYIK